MDKMTWTSWSALPSVERLRFLAEDGFWDSLTPDQRRSFFADADWQEIRRVPVAKQQLLDSLVPIEKIAETLGLPLTDIYRKMSEEGFPALLVDGEWKVDPVAVDKWRAGKRDEKGTI